MSNDYPDEPQARAITWEEYQRGGGGGGGGFDPQREPTKLGRVFRDWACKLINREKDSLDKPAQSPAEYVAALKKQRELTKEFNRISDEPGIGATLAAVRTVFHYNLGLTAPAQS